jgi:hypothetical protein
MAYREVFDLDYAMPIQREGGITLSLMTNGGEVPSIGHEVLMQYRLNEAVGRPFDSTVNGARLSANWRSGKQATKYSA